MMNKAKNANKIFALILTLSLIIQTFGFNLQTAATDIQSDSSETVSTISANEDVTESSEPTIVSEDVSKRGMYEKQFINDDGSYTAVTYPEQVHYEKDGEWVQIDNSLEEQEQSGETVLKNKDSIMNVTFAENTQNNVDGQLGTISYEGYSLSWSITATASKAEQSYTMENYKEKIEKAENTDTSAQNILSITGFNQLDKSILLDATALIPIVDTNEKDYSLRGNISAEVLSSDEDISDHPEILENISSALAYDNVLPGIDFEYSIHPSKVKENIIVNNPTDITSYRTTVATDGLTPELLDDRSITFTNADGEIIFDIPAPFMYDNNDNYSEDIIVILEAIDENTCAITYIPSYEWLNEDERAYPVTIDPTYQATPIMQGSSNTQDTYAYSGSPTSNYYTSSYLKVASGYYESYLRFPTLPDISSNYMIVGARLQLASTVSDSPTLRICRVTGSWSSSTLTWNNRPGAEAVMNLASQGQYYNTFGITDVVSGWYSGEYPNYGFMIQSPYSSSTTNLYSSDSGKTNLLPELQVCYYLMSEVNLSTGVYYIRNNSNGKYLDVYDESAYNGSNVDVWDFSGRSAQQWYVQNLGNGTYYIRSNMNRNYSLDVYGALDQDEANVNLWNNSANTFRIRKNNYNGTIAITPTFSNLRSLDVYLGSDSSQYNTNVQLCGYMCRSNQSWQFERINDVIFDYLNLLDDYASDYIRDYMPEQAQNYNKTVLVCNYIRSSEYTEPLWIFLAGSINTSFINYVESRDTRLEFLKSSNLLLDDSGFSGGIDFVHMCATINTLIYSHMDEGGWIADLQSLVKQVKTNTNDSDNYSVLYSQFWNLLNTNDQTASSMSIPDILADVDGKNIYDQLNSDTKFGDQMRAYYNSMSINRFAYFYFDYNWTQFRNYVKNFTNNTRLGIVQPYYIFKSVSTVTENQSLAAANAFANFVFSYK